MENVNQNQSTSSKMTVGEVVKGVLSSMCYLIGGIGAVITVFVLLTHGRYITYLTAGELSLMDIQTMGRCSSANASSKTRRTHLNHR